MAPAPPDAPLPADVPSPPLFDAPFTAVLFDMDGTLIDSLTSVRRSWRTWALEHGVPQERVLGWHGVPARQIVAAVLPDVDLATAVSRIEDLEVADVEGIRILPGAAEALAVVGDRAAVVTSCTARLAASRIRATGLAVPSVVVTAGDVERGKPDPEPYLRGARALGVDPAGCLVVEDAASGVASGRAAGCRTLGVLTGHPDQELGADLVVASLADVRFHVTPDGVWLLGAPGATVA